MISSSANAQQQPPFTCCIDPQDCDANDCNSYVNGCIPASAIQFPNAVCPQQCTLPGFNGVGGFDCTPETRCIDGQTTFGPALDCDATATSTTVGFRPSAWMPGGAACTMAETPADYPVDCNEDIPDCDYEICGNGLDDDCDGFADCDDADDCPPGWTYEICSSDDPRLAAGAVPGGAKGYDCDGPAAVDEDCTTAPEICGDGEDNDGDPATADDDLSTCISPDTNPEGEGDVEDDCNESCGSCDGKPVHLVTRQAYVGPHVDAHVASAQGGAFDLEFSRTWDSERAARDTIDDTSATTNQQPYPRVLGAGWRHSQDIRLVLDTTAPGDPLEPRSIMFDRPGHHVRLHQVTAAPLVYGRALGDAMSATRGTIDGLNGWLVTETGGDRWFFADTTTPTTLHPENHLRLYALYPAGVSLTTSGLSARVRFFHEQDAAPPTGWCTGLVTLNGGSGPADCTPSRGLLVGVAQEWRENSTWVQGSSLVYRYESRLTATSGAGCC